MYGFTLSIGGYDEEEDGDEEDAEDGRKKKKKNRLPKSPIGNPGEKLGFVVLGAQHAREVCRFLVRWPYLTPSSGLPHRRRYTLPKRWPLPNLNRIHFRNS